MVIDSSLAQGRIRSTVQSFYIKPIFEQYRSLVSVEGISFSSPNGDLLRKRGFGIRIGYRWERYEIETGLSTIRPAAGYRYTVDSISFNTQVRSTDYQQIPLVFRYRFWQPMQRLSLRIGAGVAYNVDLNKLSLASTDRLEEGTINKDGTVMLQARFRRQYYKERSFFSGELNASAQYQFSRHFSASFEFKRLFGAMGAVRLTATQETFNPPATKNIISQGGANSYNLNIGVAYQFGFRNRYDLD